MLAGGHRCLFQRHTNRHDVTGNEFVMAVQKGEGRDGLMEQSFAVCTVM
jgi:hypothetical protein